MKKVLSVLLTILIVCMSLPMGAISVFADSDMPTFAASWECGNVGDIVTVDIVTQNNPGIISFNLDVSFSDYILEYVGYCEGDFGGVTVNGGIGWINIVWIDVLNPDNTTDGVIATLEFRINENVYDQESGIFLSYDSANVFNSDFENVEFACEDGNVSVYPCTHTELDRHIVAQRDATCIEDGYMTIETCCMTCGMFLSEDTETFEALGHNVDGSGFCVYCGEFFDIPVLSIDTVFGKPGETVGVCVELKNNPGISELYVNLHYDSAALEFVEAETGSLHNMDIYADGDDSVILDWHHSEGKNFFGDVLVAFVCFKIKDDAVMGEYPIYTDIFSSNATGDYVSITEYPGLVSVYYCDHYNTYEQTENIIQPTCVQNGSYDKTVYCLDCGEKQACSTIVVEAKGHSFETVEAVEGTCTQKGTVSYLYCSECSGKYALESDNFTPIDQMLSDEELLTTYKHVLDNVGYCELCKEFIGTKPTFYVSSAEGYGEETVQITVSTKNNPGIVSAKLKIEYDSGVLELLDKTAGSAFAGMAFSASLSDNPYILNWVDSRNPDNTANDDFATLTFKIKRGAKGGLYPITVTYDCDDVFNKSFENITFDVVNGLVKVYDCEHNNYEVVTNEVAATCTDDGYRTVIHTCTDCDEQISIETTVIKATGHNVDENNICINCGQHIVYPTIVVGNATGKAGDIVNVPVSVINNPGIVSVKIKINYNSNVFEPIEFTAADFSDVSFGPIGTNPIIVNYVDGLNGNNSNNGVLANIQFKIKENITSGDYTISVSYDPEDVFDNDLNDVFFKTQNGVITVYDCLHENTHTVIENNIKPSCVLNGQYYEVVYCDECGKMISSHKVIVNCEGHHYSLVPALQADCTHKGNIEYKHCNTCGKNFAIDAQIFASDDTQLSEKDIVIPYKHQPDSTGICVLCGQYAFEKPTIAVSSTEGINGKTVEITISLVNNPGIVSAKLLVGYDNAVLELIGKTVGSAYRGMAFGLQTSNPFICNWVDSINPNVTSADFVTLKFRIKDDAPIGYSAIEVTYDQSDVFDQNYDDVVFDVFNGGVEVIECSHSNTITKVENNVLPDCLNDGSYDNVTVCVDCDEEISRQTVIVEAYGHDEIKHAAKEPTCTETGCDEYVTCLRCDYTTYSVKAALGHSYGNAVIENVIEPDCVSNGLYDSVHYCTVCNDELSREIIITEALGHTESFPVVENFVEPTCTDDGCYDSVIYCFECGEELDRWVEIFEASGHDIIKYDAKEPTCTEFGWYEYEECSRCDYTTRIEIAPVGHARSNEVIENEADPTCTEFGSYDVAIYCLICSEELSRVTKTIAALGHDEIGHDAVAPTCTAIGNKAYVTCSRCDYTTYEEIAALGHTEGETVVENAIAPDCETWGSYDNVCYCTVCNEELSRVTIKTAKGHKLDVNGKCSVCKETVEEPTFFVTSDKALLGKEVKVNVVVKNNPGIVSINLGIDYDSDVFELVTAEGGAFTTVAFGPTTNHPFYVNWVDSINPNNTTDGIVATLTFKVKDEAAVGTSVITIDYDPDDVYDANFENVGFEKNYGFMEVRDYTPGDANDDGVINNKDLGLLMQYIIEEDVFVMLYACDVNADGKINNRDYALLMQYVNGWNVELLK